MKYYQRTVTKRESVNKFGRLGYVEYKQQVKTNNIDKFNKGLKIKFAECAKTTEMIHTEKDKIIETKVKVLSKTWGNK